MPREISDEPVPEERGRDLDRTLVDPLRGLESRCRDLLATAATDDGVGLDTAWPALEADLLDDLDAVEDVILPTYAVEAPHDAQRVVDEHARLRALITSIGLDEGHAPRLAHLRQLVSALASLAVSEATWMYPWAEQHIALVGSRMMFARVDHSLERAAHCAR